MMTQKAVASQKQEKAQNRKPLSQTVVCGENLIPEKTGNVQREICKQEIGAEKVMMQSNSAYVAGTHTVQGKWPQSEMRCEDELTRCLQ